MRSGGIAITVYALIIGLAYFAEEVIYFFEKKHRELEESIKDALSL